MSEQNAISKKIEKCVEHFSREQKIKWDNNPYIYAVEKAYEDVKRTMSGIGKMGSQKKKVLENIGKGLESYFSKAAPKSKEDFDKDQGMLCQIWTKGFDQDEQLACYGKAQKIVNMAFKYLYCIMKNDKPEYFKFCHMPLDSYTLSFLKELQEKRIITYETKWSSIKDPTIYKEIQKVADDWADGNQLTTLEAEFIVWYCVKAYKACKEYYNVIKGFGIEMPNILKVNDFSLEYLNNCSLKDYIEKVLKH